MNPDAFEPHFEGGVYIGYALPLSYGESGVVVPEVVAGYRFNPHLFVGGSVANIVDDFSIFAGCIPVMADLRALLSCGSRSTIYGEFGMGVAAGYGGQETNFAIQVGPGFEYGRFSFSAIAMYCGDEWRFMKFNVGYKF